MKIKNLLWDFNSKPTNHGSAIMTIILKSKLSDTEQLPKARSHARLVLTEITNKFFSKRHTAFTQLGLFFNCLNVIAILKFYKNQTFWKAEIIFLFQGILVVYWSFFILSYSIKRIQLIWQRSLKSLFRNWIVQLQNLYLHI